MRTALIGLAVSGFLFGAAMHAADFIRDGWWPYRSGPTALILFWNALLPFDLIIMAMLVVRPRLGLTAGILLMVADVAANLYAWRIMNFRGFEIAVPLQAAFLGLLLIMAPAILGLPRNGAAR